MLSHFEDSCELPVVYKLVEWITESNITRCALLCCTDDSTDSAGICKIPLTVTCLFCSVMRKQNSAIRPQLAPLLVLMASSSIPLPARATWNATSADFLQRTGWSATSNTPTSPTVSNIPRSASEPMHPSSFHQLPVLFTKAPTGLVNVPIRPSPTAQNRDDAGGYLASASGAYVSSPPADTSAYPAYPPYSPYPYPYTYPLPYPHPTTEAPDSSTQETSRFFGNVAEALNPMNALSCPTGNTGCVIQKILGAVFILGAIALAIYLVYTLATGQELGAGFNFGGLGR